MAAPSAQVENPLSHDNDVYLKAERHNGGFLTEYFVPVLGRA
jgi:hypothetical protein